MRNNQLCQCPVCAYIANSKLFTLGWVNEFSELLPRYSGLGHERDISGMNWDDRYGYYLTLKSMKELEK